MASKSKIKRIAVMTGGGDCPGLNAVIRAVTKTAINTYGLEVMGIEDGYLGLIENRLRRLESHDVSNILTLGGTILGTSNVANPFKWAVTKAGKTTYVDVSDKCMDTLKEHDIDALICIGGDGTMSAASKFAKMGIPVIGVPKTIDNDLVGTDFTFGFDTAVTTAAEAIDKIHTTASSHHRVMIIEVMGRYAGWIALYAGIASGSDVILIPEFPYNLEKVTSFIRERSRHGKHFSIVTVAEGATEQNGTMTIQQQIKNSPDPIRLGGIASKLAYSIQNITNIETRATILGHIQRGGTPTPHDRLLATSFGHYAMLLLCELGVKNHLVVIRDNRLGSIPLSKVADKTKVVPKDHPLVKAAMDVNTCFGF
jgi:6-phosphofructokinase 1